jgi:3-hydroxyisobutyrate dehydrogenase-like beta-hydroxyacid dehydrogenase
MIRKVTLIGLGAMGGGIAQSILKGGFDLTVYNGTIAKTKPFVKEGAKRADSPREAVAEAEVVISMVADDNASRQI